MSDAAGQSNLSRSASPALTDSVQYEYSDDSSTYSDSRGASHENASHNGSHIAASSHSSSSKQDCEPDSHCTTSTSASRDPEQESRHQVSSQSEQGYVDACSRQPAQSDRSSLTNGDAGSSTDCHDEYFSTAASSCHDAEQSGKSHLSQMRQLQHKLQLEQHRQQQQEEEEKEQQQQQQQQLQQSIEVTVRPKSRMSADSHECLSPQPQAFASDSPAAASGVCQPAARPRSTAPQGVYGGEGTHYPACLLKRRLAAFPVVVPRSVQPRPGCPGAVAASLEALLLRWEVGEQLGSCAVCGCGHEVGGGFIGYPVCCCPCLHAECALLLACTAAPELPACPRCCREIRVVPAEQPRKSGSPLREPWFSGVMGLCLLSMVWLLACVLMLLLCLVEPSRRDLLAATSWPMLVVCFSLPALLLLSCFLIGWLLDKYTARAWETHRRRLQLAYCEAAMTCDAERVLAASLMACTFLDYHAASYPFPKGAHSYLNYYFLLPPLRA